MKTATAIQCKRGKILNGMMRQFAGQNEQLVIFATAFCAHLRGLQIEISLHTA
jgi:hypothetical protein